MSRPTLRKTRRSATRRLSHWSRLENLERRLLLTATMEGNEFRVNDYIAGSQTTSPSTDAVVTNTGGDFVITYGGRGANDATGIFTQRFDAAGTALGAPVQVNTTTLGTQTLSSVGASDDGSFVVAWSGQGTGDRDGAFLQRFNAAGQAVGAESLINVTTAGKQTDPAVAMKHDGSFVAVWSGNGTGDSDGVFLRRFSANGTPLSGEIRVNVTTTRSQDRPAVAMDDAGNFVVVWTSSLEDGAGLGVFARRYDANGNPLGTPFQVNSSSAGDQLQPQVAMAADGQFWVVWESSDRDGDGFGVMARRYSATGTPQGSEFLVNSTTTGEQRYAKVSIADNGRVAVSWSSLTPAGGGWDVMAQYFDADGVRDGGEFRVNTTAAGGQRFSSIALGNDGDALAAWSGNGPGDTSGVFAQRLAATAGFNNLPPNLDPIGNRVVGSGQLLTFTATASDPDGPASGLRFQLDPDDPSIPAGAAIDPITGVFTWTPTAAQLGTHTFTVLVVDSGHPSQADSEQFTVTVGQVNAAPSFTAGGNETVNEDAGAQAKSWATNVLVGPPSEFLSQSPSFLVTTDRPELFAVAPAINPAGVLSYTPAANANGVASVTVVLMDNGGTANGGVDQSAPVTFTITINPVNDAPTFTPGPNQSIAEDSPLQALSWATNVLAGPTNEFSQTLLFEVSATNTSLFAQDGQPTIGPDGVLRYIPAANANGVSTVTVRLRDSGGTTNGGVDQSDPVTFTITITPVNDAPQAVADSFSRDEDSTQTTLDVLANDIKGADALPNDTLTVVALGTPSQGGSVALGPNGANVLYTPAANFFGTETFTYTLRDSAGTEATATVTMTINPINDAPSFALPQSPNQTVLEDAGAQSVANFASNLSAGPNESSQTLTFLVTTAQPNLFAENGQPTISANGTLTYTPAANASGVATIDVRLEDNGSNTAPNSNLSAIQSFTITITPVNDAPSFTLPASPNQTVADGAGLQTVTNFATNLSVGPGEAALNPAQTLSFLVSVPAEQQALFTQLPQISSTGTLTYTMAPTATTGTATVNVRLQDSGGTANGGVDTSAVQSFTITVVNVNSPPSFSLPGSPNQAINEDAGPQTVADFVTGISPGPSDENGQTVTLSISVPEAQQALFSALPTLTGSGTTRTLNYTPAANANGVVTVSVQAMDNGGTMMGGQDTSAVQMFTISIGAVNDAPSFTLMANPNQSVAEDSGPQTLVNFIASSSVGPADEAAQTISYLVSVDNASLFSAAPTISPEGTLTYTPAANQSGQATVTVRAMDNGGTANSGVDQSAEQTFTITVTATNDSPVATADSFGVDEDSSEMALNVLANDNPGPDADQSETIMVVGVGTPSQGGSVQIGPNGADVRYTPAPNFFGTETFTYTIRDSGGLEAMATVTVTVDPINDAPSFALPQSPNQTVLEDAGAQSVPNFAADISAGPNESGQTLAFIVTTAQPNLFTQDGQPAISAAGTLSYTLAANANGVATIDVRLEDNGSNTAPNSNLSATQSFTITITPVNDAPSFNLAQTELTRAEDAGLVTVPNFAQDIVLGPADEAGQTASFTVNIINVIGNVSSGAFFTTAPAISPDGTLSFQTAPNAFGLVQIQVLMNDSGGTDNGGVASAAPRSFGLIISDTNDTPVAVDDTASLNEDAGQTVLNVLANDTTGPDDPAEKEAYLITGVSAVSSGGDVQISVDQKTLLYTPAADFFGQETFTYTIRDAGGLESQATVTVTVDPVNDVPSFSLLANPDQSLLEDAGLQTVENFATGLSAGPANEAGQTVGLIVSVPEADQALFAVLPQLTGSGSERTLTYTPAPNAQGTVTVTVRAMDNGGTAGGGVDTSADQTFTITIAAVNDPPSFLAPDVTVPEGSGSVSVPNWVQQVSPGPADEAGQSVVLQITGTDNPGLFAVAPSVAPDGTLSFTVADSAVGSATVSIVAMDNGGTAGGGVDTSGVQTFTITVRQVNDAPSFSLPANPNQSILEDAGPQQLVDFATNVIPGPVDESAQTVTLLVSVDHPELFSVQPTFSGSGANRTLNYTPAPQAFGVATITVRAKDDGGTALSGDVDESAPQVFTITIGSVNDAPSFTIPVGIVDRLEDAGAVTIPNFAQAISLGPANEADQTGSFSFSTFNYNGNVPEAQFFTTAPTISADGTLSFQVAPNVFGLLQLLVRLTDNGGTANGGIDQSGTVAMSISVMSVNDAPSFDLIATPNQSIPDDGVARTVDGFALNMTAGPLEVQNLNFLVSTSNDAAFSQLPAINAATGQLTYQVSPDFHAGVITVNVRLHDDGGTIVGGVDTSPAQTFTITVGNVNTAPSFTLVENPDQTVQEDSGAQTVAGFASNISAGPVDESGQALAFLVTGNTNASLFASGPAISADGTLTYTPAANLSGSATITVVLMDDGGTEFGGQDTSGSRTFTITVGAVNDAPSFALPANPNQVVDEDAAQQSLGFATNLSAGPADESGQQLTFLVSVDLPGLFAVAPSIDGSGVLTYQSAANQFGVATVTVRLMDDGGMAQGGVDQSPEQTFTITINPVNDPPSFSLPVNPNQTVSDNAGAQTVAGFASDITAGPNEASQGLSFEVTAGTPGLFSTQPQIDPATGALTYTPQAGMSGTSVITVVLRDDGGTPGNAADDLATAQQTFSITVNHLETEPTINVIDGDDMVSANELTAINFNITASDPDSLPLTFTLDANPHGASLTQLNDTTANFVWTPLESQGPNSYTFTVRVAATDGGMASRTFSVNVAEVNLAPVLGNIEPKQGVVGTLLTFTATANDNDSPANTLTYTLESASDPSVNAAIDPASGVFQWTPSQAGSFTVVVRVTDNGNPALSDTQVVQLSVAPAGNAPILTADLAVDTGTDGDRVSSETDIVGQIATSGTVTAFTASYGDAPGGSDPVDLLSLGVLGSGNNFTIDFATLQTIRLFQFGSGTVSDGSYTLNLSATNNSGQTGTLAFNFTRDTTNPITPNFKVSVDQDPDQNDTVNVEFVTLVGQTEPNATVVLDRGSVSVLANASGQFQFNNVQLFSGANSLGVVATDVAGNITAFSRTITYVPGGAGLAFALTYNPPSGSPSSSGGASNNTEPVPAASIDATLDELGPSSPIELDLPELAGPVSDPDLNWDGAVDAVFGGEGDEETAWWELG